MPIKISFLTPKILTYFFNAYVDAAMTAEAVTLIKTGQVKNPKSEAGQRVIQLMTSGKCPEGIAYTLYYVNGLANFLHATNLLPLTWPHHAQSVNLIQKYVKKLLKTLAGEHFYQEYGQTATMRWLYWPLFVVNSQRWFDSFCQQYQLSRPAMDPQELKEELRAAAMEVQQQNIAWNQEVGRVLVSQEKSQLLKVQLLRQAAAETSRPAQFLRWCRETQRAAARWDQFYHLFSRN